MSDAKCVIYVKTAKNAIFDAYAIQHIPYIDMAIWVSKDASGHGNAHLCDYTSFK